jgi:hypothetical protein
MIFSLSLLVTALLSTAPGDSIPTLKYTAPATFVLQSIPPDSALQQKNLLPSVRTEESILTDSSNSAKNISIHDTTEFIPPEEFTFAGQQRYILDGSLPLRVSKVKPITVAAVQGTYFGVLIALHIYQENTFWRQSTSFRVRDNYDESLGANYGGHGIAGYYLSYLSTESLLACGISTKLAPIYGSLMGLGYQVYVEVLDGYGSNFALSPYEMYSNVIGVVWYLSSQYSPFLQNFVPKYNYYPASWFGYRAKAASETPIDDYSAWNYWVAINVPHLISKSYSSFWPSWLDVAFGYSARNLGYADATRIITLSLDYNLIKLLPDGGASWNWFKQTLNFFKLPSPTIEWSFDRDWKRGPVRFYLAYPFPIKIGNTRF